MVFGKQLVNLFSQVCKHSLFGFFGKLLRVKLIHYCGKVLEKFPRVVYLIHVHGVQNLVGRLGYLHSYLVAELYDRVNVVDIDSADKLVNCLVFHKLLLEFIGFRRD